MKKVGIVILNYETYQESINCVNSIKLHKLSYVHIVIVDNASSNDSYKILSEKYKNDSSVHVIKVEKNKGFARGNNIGITYLRKFNINYILLLNSDTIILEDNYLERMIAICKKDVGVIGSNVKLLYECEQGGEMEDLTLFSSVFHLVQIICQYYHIYFPFYLNKEKRESLRIHGCAILLTPAFFRKYKFLWPYTFMYREEMILSIMMEKAKLKTVIADTYIYHLQGRSTENCWSHHSRRRIQLELYSSIQQVIVKLLPYSLLRRIIYNYGKKTNKKNTDVVGGVCGS